MKDVIKNISKEWKFFYAVIAIGFISIAALCAAKRYLKFGGLPIQISLLVWYILIIGTVIYITWKNYKEWKKTIFTYGGENPGFVEIEEEINLLREDKSKEKTAYQTVNKVYADLNASLSDIMERQNYIRNRLKLTNEIIQMILNIGIAVILGFLPLMGEGTGNINILLYIFAGFFVVFMCMITFPTALAKPGYSKVQAVYEYEEKRLEEELYRRQKEL